MRDTMSLSSLVQIPIAQITRELSLGGMNDFMNFPQGFSNDDGGSRIDLGKRAVKEYVMSLESLSAGIAISSQLSDNALRIKRTVDRAKLDVPSQLDGLRGIEPGWLDGEGEVPSSTGLDWLAEAFGRHYPSDAPLPYVYPMPNGGVQMEWSIGKREISLEVDLATRRGEWSCYDMETDSSEEKVLGLDSSDGWKWIADSNMQ